MRWRASPARWRGRCSRARLFDLAAALGAPTSLAALGVGRRSSTRGRDRAAREKALSHPRPIERGRDPCAALATPFAGPPPG
jgi:hypothetical protein